ncbi:hypothetical protein B0H14DRAFT_2578635 [Mycena olivaceomarginata]|nr:hypothetical protein B0H14DRAFT_2578635 [Mycena olivaceomarginata]
MAPNETPFYRIFEGSDWYPIDTEIGSEEKPLDVEYWTYLKNHEGDWSATTKAEPSKSAIRGNILPPNTGLKMLTDLKPLNYVCHAVGVWKLCTCLSCLQHSPRQRWPGRTGRKLG